jgi:hypothetical protein
MEQTKLTVRLPRELVEGAKRYAKDHDTTLTRLVSGYFRQLGTKGDLLQDAPIVRRLSGILPEEASVGDYYQYLEAKYGSQGQGPDRP